MSYFTKPDYTKLTEAQQEFVDMIHNAFEFAREKGLANDYLNVSMFLHGGVVCVSNEYYGKDAEAPMDYFYEEVEDDAKSEV